MGRIAIRSALHPFNLRIARIPSTLFSALNTSSPPTVATTTRIHPCWKFKLKPSSRPYVVSSRPPNELGRRIFRAMASSPRLPPGDRSLIFRAAKPPQHFVRSISRPGRLGLARLGRRLSPQTGGTHRHRPLRLHSQSSLPRKCGPGVGRGRRNALVDLRPFTQRVFHRLLFSRDAKRRGRTPSASHYKF